MVWSMRRIQGCNRGEWGTCRCGTGGALALILTLGLALVLVWPASAAAESVKRLVMTDGNYQTVTEWKAEGDRVKYFSAERGEWEEIPAALVDWKATDEWNATAAKTQAEELKQVTGEEVAERKEEMLNTPQVMPEKAPELRLPAQGGVFLLEQRAGKPVLQSIEGNKTQENEHEGTNRLMKAVIPIASQVQTIELKGPAAKVRVHTPTPSIFVDVENEQGPIRGEYFRIVRLEPKRGVRVVAKNKVGLGGEQSVRETFLHSRAEKFSGDWWKLIPVEELKPGEYAIVIDGLGENGTDLVWDFGVEK
jgi:hypothetical protein